MRAWILVLLLLAPAVRAAEPGAVALVVRDDAAGTAWPYAGPVAVDGRAAMDVDAAVRARLREASPVALEAARDDEGVLVRATSDVSASVAVHVASTGVVLVHEETQDAPLSPDAPLVLRFHGSAERLVVWVAVTDDPTGRFATGEVLQALVLDGERAASAGRVVLVEARRCPDCGDAEAAARAAASAYAGGLPPREGYVRAPTLREAAAAVVLVAVAGAILVPWRRA